jgi:hypothetical protein
MKEDTAKEKPVEETEERTSAKETKKISMVPIPEDFQKKVMEIIEGCTEPECAFIRDQCYKREDALRKQNETKDEVSMDDFNAVAQGD